MLFHFFPPFVHFWYALEIIAAEPPYLEATSRPRILASTHYHYTSRPAEQMGSRGFILNTKCKQNVEATRKCYRDCLFKLRAYLLSVGAETKIEDYNCVALFCSSRTRSSAFFLIKKFSLPFYQRRENKKNAKSG